MRNLIRWSSASLVCLLLASCGSEAPQTSTVSVQASRAQIQPASPYDKLVQQLYVGYFGRPADPAGLAYFTASYQAFGAPTTMPELLTAYGQRPDIRTLVDIFAASQESAELYPGGGYKFIRAVYNNLFNRDPDLDGGEYWANKLNYNVISRANAVMAIIAGAQGSDAQKIADKLAAASAFTREVDARSLHRAYDGQLSNALARGFLAAVPSFADTEASSASLGATLTQIAQLAAGNYSDVDAGARRIVMLASASQLEANRDKLDEFAAALVSDLNRKAGLHGPKWTADVTLAGPDPATIREQVKPYQGIFLVGRVPVPTFNGSPYLDFYRQPECEQIGLAADGVSATHVLELRSTDARCNGGSTLSVLRGRTDAQDNGDVRRKLGEMIAYHSHGEASNANWQQRYQSTHALWAGGWLRTDPLPFWEEIGLYLNEQITNVQTGSGQQRKDAFINCISSNNEMCEANLHGSPRLIFFEGPGKAGVNYSDDSVGFDSSELADNSVHAKYLSLLSCSTQNFLVEKSMGTSLLMAGRSLLTRGFVTDVFISSAAEEVQIRNNYSQLSKGATYADIMFNEDLSFTATQGDPYITFRERATGAQPHLAIDGKRYYGGSQIIPMTMPDAVGGSSTQRMITLSNSGSADLKLLVPAFVEQTGYDDGKGGPPEYEYGYRAQYLPGGSITFSDGRVEEPVPHQMGGGISLTLKPGASVVVPYQLAVRTEKDKPKATGVFTGRIAIRSDDPNSSNNVIIFTTRVR